MIVTLISRKRIHSITLPPKKEGQYWLKKLISIEGIDGEWILKSNKKARIIDYNAGKQEIAKVKLEPTQIYHIRTADGEDLIIFTEPVTDNRQIYEKATVLQEARITIGRNGVNEILFKNQFASSRHADLIYKNKTWYIQDVGSTNGTFVNNKRVKNAELSLGDVIFIMGFKIIIGTDFIAYNNPDNCVKIQSSNLKPFKMQKYKTFLDEIEDDEEIKEEYFYRSPRFKRDIEAANFNISSAPSGQTGDEMPASLTVGPAITMGMGSMVSVVTSLATFQLPAALASISMLGGSLVWPNLTRKYQKKIQDEKEAIRQEKYTKYLEMLDKQIDAEISKQKEILQENFISVRECAKRIINTDISLWDRTPDQNDFLKLRVGVGETPLNANINYQKKEFDLNSDNLDEKMLELAEEPKVIKDVPIIVSFFQAYMSGIIGTRQDVVSFVKGLILQLMTYYSYDEVKFVFVYDEEEDDEFEFVKWLPHTWNNEKTFRYIATNSSELKELSSIIEKEIINRKDLHDSELKNTMPYYIVFALSKELMLRSDIIKRLSIVKHNVNFSLITCFDELKYVPKDCSTVIELNSENSKIFNKYDTSGNHVRFTPDILIEDDLTDLSVILSKLKLDLELGGEGYSLPKMITFLEMYDVGKVEHLNILTRWKENDITRSLEAPVGVDSYGDLFKLDFHQNFSGAHGLVAGTTGSGKSEFLMTYILSLAINYDPREMSFVLIDFKGGGMANAFENLPHIKGIVTNLDKSQINRVLLSFEGELTRRQIIFEETKKKLGLSTLEIYDYQKYYREGKIKEPISHLFIIVDEFAELKSQQPEAMREFNRIARIGRSLGIHLILATQKPSGIIDSQTDSNINGRICLKVQDKSDSNDMIGTPDAANLIDTGRFYLKDRNGTYEIGQSAWAGAPYIPQEKVDNKKNNNIQIIDKLGKVLKEGKIEKKKLIQDNSKKQLKAITDYIQKIANEENIHTQSLWLPIIPQKIYLEEIENKYMINHYNSVDEISPLIGEYDVPENQKQLPFYLSLSKGKNLVILGMVNSGKKMFITTMIYSLLKNYNSKYVGLYVLDFDAETLGVFSKAPHVGDIVFKNEKEKIINLFKLLSAEYESRKKQLIDYSGNIEEYNRDSGNTMKRIFIVIHNYENFKNIYENQESIFVSLLKDASKCGINFIVTATSSRCFKMDIFNSFGQEIILQMKDETDYFQVPKKSGEERPKKIIPYSCEGRGIFKEKDDIFEFQVANIIKTGSLNTFLKEFCEGLKETNIVKTKKIPVLPNIVNRDEIESYIDTKLLKVPVGIETNSLEMNLYDFKRNYINIISSRDMGAYQCLLESLITIYSESVEYKTIVLDISNELHIKGNCKNACNSKECCDIINTILSEYENRVNIIKECENDGKDIPNFDNMIIFVNSMYTLLNCLEGDCKKNFISMLQKWESKANINIIISELAQKLSSIKLESWYKQNVNSNNAIWVGSGLLDQYSINISATNSEMKQLISSEYGFVIENGRATKVKFINLGE